MVYVCSIAIIASVYSFLIDIITLALKTSRIYIWKHCQYPGELRIEYNQFVVRSVCFLDDRNLDPAGVYMPGHIIMVHTCTCIVYCVYILHSVYCSVCVYVLCVLYVAEIIESTDDL